VRLTNRGRPAGEAGTFVADVVSGLVPGVHDGVGGEAEQAADRAQDRGEVRQGPSGEPGPAGEHQAEPAGCARIVRWSSRTRPVSPSRSRVCRSRCTVTCAKGQSRSIPGWMVPAATGGGVTVTGALFRGAGSKCSAPGGFVVNRSGASSTAVRRSAAITRSYSARFACAPPGGGVDVAQEDAQPARLVCDAGQGAVGSGELDRAADRDPLPAGTEHEGRAGTGRAGRRAWRWRRGPRTPPPAHR
jgi:hypothetical protein